MKKTNYIGKAIEYTMLIVHVKFPLLLKGLLLLIILCTLHTVEVKAQDKFNDEKEVIAFSYDEIPVFVIVEGYKNFYVDAIYANNELLYVNVEELFRTLNIPCVIGQNGDILNGFIENESRTYFIDYATGQIKVGGKMINAKKGLVKEMGTLFMESSLFAEAFGITLTFNYRAITIILKSNFELPVIKQQRIEKMRSNIAKIKGEEIADTIVQRNYHLFKLGTLDWSVASTQTGKRSTDNPGKGSIDNNFSLGVGTEFLYGEADISVNYYDQYKFDNRQLNYLWRWVDNNKSIIKQAQVGRITTQTISSIYSPMIGAVIRNSPTTIRKATGYYSINEFTEPNWTVELYINNVMVDYTKADASGLYVFKVPNVYGYTTLKLKFYGPLGEERTEERTRNVPYTVMSANEFEYGLSAGIVQDSTLARFGKSEFNYGVNRIMSIGGGLEYLSSIPNGAFIPFARITIQPFSKLTLNGEYAHGVKSRGLVDYYIRKDILLEIDYTKFVEGQLATRFNANEERKVKLSFPLRFKKIIGYARLDYTQLVYNAFIYNQANVMVSTYYKLLSANSSTQLNWIDKKTPYVSSELALTYRLKKGYTIRPSTRYNVSGSNLMSYKVAIEKSIPRGYFSVSYERNVMYNSNFINLNFKYDLSFAKTNVSASHSNGTVYTSQSAQGSIALGSGNKYIHTSNNSSVSRGGISLYPFLDLNQNGIFDKGERMVKLTSVRVMGGKTIFSKKDSIVRIPELNAFTKYLIEFNDIDLENIAWRFKHKTYQVLIDPNQFKRVYIPIIVVGEVSGMAYMNKENAMKGIGRILIKFYKKNSAKVVAETLSESDGYIDYMGFAPGEYVARVDSLQLSNLNFTVDHPQKEFTIKTLADGDIVRGMDFVLSSKQNDSLKKKNIATEPINVIPVNDLKKLPLSTKPPTTDTDMPIEQKIVTQAKDTVILMEKKKVIPTTTPVLPKEQKNVNTPTNPVIPKELKKVIPLEKNKMPTSKDSVIPIKHGIVSPQGVMKNVKPQPMPRLIVPFSIIQDTMVYEPDIILYRVQLFALRNPINFKDYFKQLLAEVPGLTIVETIGEDGLFHYSTGAFTCNADAREFLRIISRVGWKDGFVAIVAESEVAILRFRLKYLPVERNVKKVMKQ